MTFYGMLPYAFSRTQLNEDANNTIPTDSSSVTSSSNSPDAWPKKSPADSIYGSTTSGASSEQLVLDDTLLVQIGARQSKTLNDEGRTASWVEKQRFESDKTTVVVPAAQRQHPRRTAAAAPLPGGPQRPHPCTLTRQDERAEGFVALLVVFTSGLVEAIWPLSACPPRVDPRFYGGGVLPLKTFIQETLRRSKTSYSTLQVALYYLILLKAHLPKGDLTQEQPKGEDCRAMQCGRRMFLSALILASKYLQDRNYSTRAWSKISGLRTTEINQNEFQYLNAIDWKLHLTKETFDRWSRIVLRLSALPSKDSMQAGWNCNLAQRIGWKNLISRMTPDLPEDFSEFETGLITPPISPPSDPYEPSERDEDQGSPTSNDLSLSRCTTPVSSELASRSVDTTLPIPPPMPRPHNLPTPQTTPCQKFIATPAVSALKSYPRCSATYATILNGRRECLAKATLDRCPPPQPLPQRSQPICPSRRSEMLRRTSPTRSVTSLASSPESMVSDNLTTSTRSRSSSISSVSSGLLQYLKAGLRAEDLPETFNDECAGEAKMLEMMKNCTTASAIPHHLDLPLPPTSYPLPAVQETSEFGIYPTQIGQLTMVDFESACPTRQVALSKGHGRLTDQKLMTELEAAQLLCSLPRDSSRAVALTQNCEAKAKPKQHKKSATPSKAHKRTHSKANDNLFQEVRQNLLSSYTGSPMHIEVFTSTTDETSKSPIIKGSQSPSKAWASIKTPVPIHYTDKRKRHCATEDCSPAAVQAANLLRPSISGVRFEKHILAFERRHIQPTVK